MKPPYQITSKILHLISNISQKIGEVNANYLIKNNPQLRKQNQIKTIHSSLSIEGNTLSEDQITSILENKRVLGPEKDIKEVLNALKVYQELDRLKFNIEKDYLKAHKTLMNGLVENPGKYRKIQNKRSWNFKRFKSRTYRSTIRKYTIFDEGTFFLFKR